MQRLRLPLSLVCAFWLAAVTPTSAAAMDRVELVIGATAGGTAYAVAQGISSLLEETGHFQVQILSQPGPKAIAAIDAIKSTRTDAERILVASAGMLSVNPVIYEDYPLEELSSFRLLGTYSILPLYVIVRPESGAATLEEFKREILGRSRPAVYASAGIGSTMHIASEILVSRLKVEARHLPYRGSSQAIESLLSGRGPDFMIEPAATARPLIASGRVRCVAHTDESEDAVAGCRSFRDQGLHMPVSQYHALVASSEIDGELASRIMEALHDARSDEDVNRYVEALGGRYVGDGPNELAVRIAQDRKIIRETMD